MQTFENYLTHKDKEYYLCTEYDFDHADQLILTNFDMRDESGENVSQKDLVTNQALYLHVGTILSNNHAVCHGGAPV